jgi:ketosteroid isomerase-like protein
MKQVLCLLLCAVTIYSCTSRTSETTQAKTTDSAFDVSKVKQAIETSNKKFADAFLKGDSAAVVNLYHSDAEVYPPNMKAGNRTVTGSMVATIAKSGIKSFTLNTTNVTGNAEEAVETGTFEMGDGKKTIDKGKYIVIWKPENGEWKLWRDIWNSDNPSQPGK